MRRNRTKYIVYFEPWGPGKHKVVYSKFQMKKELLKSNPGSEGWKMRLIFNRDGSISFWNKDLSCDDWVRK